MRSLPLFLLAVLVSGCSSPSDTVRAGQVMVVDAADAPVVGALVMPEVDDDRRGDTREPSSDQVRERTSDAQGLIHADLRVYYWPSDDSLHFVVTRKGYEDTSVAVSRELFPPLFKIKIAASTEEPTVLKPKSKARAAH